MSGDRLGESSQAIRARVQAARDRFSKLDAKHPIFCSADMRVGEIRQFCRLQDEGQSLMRAAMTQLNLSARAYHRIPSTTSGQASNWRARLRIWRGVKTFSPGIWRRLCTFGRLKLMHSTM